MGLLFWLIERLQLSHVHLLPRTVLHMDVHPGNMAELLHLQIFACSWSFYTEICKPTRNLSCGKQITLGW